MRTRTIILGISLSLSLLLNGQATRNLGEVTAWGKRPLSEIGSQRTILDSLSLRSGIAQSMADVLASSSAIYVKNYGRATMSTVSFRGTSPSHTQVSWNGIDISNPMMGQTDFSTIPAYFIDNASLLHGTASVSETSGGLGGAIKLQSSASNVADGVGLHYVQGIGSYATFDEFLKLTYGSEHWSLSVRASRSDSNNDYTYTNRDRKVNIYDENHNIVGQYYPRQKNRCGDFHDTHLMANAMYNSNRGNRLGISLWGFTSNRGLPLLTTDNADGLDYSNRQRERTLRFATTFDHSRSRWRLALTAGYTHTWMAYDYQREVAGGIMATMTRSRSRLNTLFAKAEAGMSFSENLYATLSLKATQNIAESSNLNDLSADGHDNSLGYDVARCDISSAATLAWRPLTRLGLNATVRQEFYGYKSKATTPALMIDALLLQKINLTFKASVSRNYRMPSLNDFYFMPGGNPNLKHEHGYTYDLGLESTSKIGANASYSLSVNWFDSRINDWILWLPTSKGFFSPRNVKQVHAYGLELKADLFTLLPHSIQLKLNGSASWTPSINNTASGSTDDLSVGCQLPYVPRFSASLSAHGYWRSWHIAYFWTHYGRRNTMTASQSSIDGHLPSYFMNNVAIEKQFHFRPLDLNIKLAVNNLFNEKYLSVLSHPMPGINFEIYFAITPKLY